MKLENKIDNIIGEAKSVDITKALVSKKQIDNIKKIADKMHRAGKDIEMEHAKISKLSRILLVLPGDLSIGTIMQEALGRLEKILRGMNANLMSNNIKGYEKSKQELTELTSTIALYLSDMSSFVKKMESKFSMTRNDVYNSIPKI